MLEDEFSRKAKEWDSVPERVRIADEFAAKVAELTEFNSRSVVLDFGCGTGLIGLRFGKQVKTLYMLDTSEAMLGMLKAKLANKDYGNVTILSTQLHEAGLPENSLDVVFTSMALHHVENVPEVLGVMSRILKKGGKLIVGELLPEDGSFHGDDVVPHNGFNPDELALMFEKNGFSVEQNFKHDLVSKPDKYGVLRQYGTFVLVGKK